MYIKPGVSTGGIGWHQRSIRRAWDMGFYDVICELAPITQAFSATMPQ
jgi:hypothetical protein